MEQVEQIKVLIMVIDKYNATSDFKDICNLAKVKLQEKINQL